MLYIPLLSQVSTTGCSCGQVTLEFSSLCTCLHFDMCRLPTDSRQLLPWNLTHKLVPDVQVLDWDNRKALTHLQSCLGKLSAPSFGQPYSLGCASSCIICRPFPTQEPCPLPDLMANQAVKFWDPCYGQGSAGDRTKQTQFADEGNHQIGTSYA